MFVLNKILRNNIKALSPYSTARHDYSEEASIYLDANENPYGSRNRYPDPFQSKLKNRIANIKGVEEKSLFIGNGSDEIIDLCFRIFCDPGKDKAIIFTPGYGMYSVSAAINDVELIRIKLDEVFQIPLGETLETIKKEKPKLIFMCSPNNPSANLMEKERVISILENFSGILVMDEAYIDFSPEHTFLPLIDEFPNLLIMQTMSKAWASASLRIGMAFAQAEIISVLNSVKAPYNISSPNMEAALDQLDQMEVYRENLNSILVEKERLERELLNCEGVIKVYPSDANFFLVEFRDANRTYEYLLSKGIVVRNRHEQVKNCLRITVGSKEENNRLIEALRE